MKRLPTACLVLALGAVAAAPGAHAQSIQVRIMPPDRAQFLQHQRFDIRVEATAPGAADEVTGLSVLLDGVDVTARGRIEAGAAKNVRSWIFRDAALGILGPRVFTASAAGTAEGMAVSGTARSTVTVREWDQSQRRSAAGRAAFDAGSDFRESSEAASRALEASRRDEPRGEDESLHVGGLDPAFHTLPDALLASSLPRAKNVILFIGDGMGVAHRTAARVL